MQLHAPLVLQASPALVPPDALCRLNAEAPFTGHIMSAMQSAGYPEDEKATYDNLKFRAEKGELLASDVQALATATSNVAVDASAGVWHSFSIS